MKSQIALPVFLIRLSIRQVGTMTKAFLPVFLLCSERSGSNLLIRLLDGHPDFCGPPPSHLIRMLALNLTRFGDVKNNDQNWGRLIEISVGIMQNQLGIWRSQWDEKTLLDNVQERSVRGIISAIYQTETNAQGKKFCIIKENRVHLFLPYLLSVFPHSRYIWLVRDPRDMALSWKNSANHPGDIRTGASVWMEDQERFRLIYGYLQETDQVHHLRYEDLLKMPEATLSKLCDFLAIPFSKSMLDYHNKEDTRKNATRISNWENLARPLMSANSGKFIDALSQKEIGYIESLCCPEMITHAYKLTAPPQSPATALMAVEEELGDEDKHPTDCDLSLEEKAIRTARQSVIDQINALPIGLKK